MEEKAADQDGAVYCSEHPYPPGATAAAGAAASGICAFCLQEKLGMLVSSSKSSPFHPPPPLVSASTSSPPSGPSGGHAISQPPLPLHPSAGASHKVTPSQKSAIPAAGGLKRSKSVAPRPEGPLAPAPSADSQRKKCFWSFLHLSSSSSSSSHRSASSNVANNGGGGASAARRNSVSVASSAALGGRLVAIAEPENQGRRSEGSSSSSFGRKVARSRSVGCGSRSFSGDFLERLSTVGFGDCALRRVESHREPKSNKHALGGGGHLGSEDDDEHAPHHRIKCAGFFGGVSAAPPQASSYWLSSASDGGGGGARAHGSSSRSHPRSWAWALASPMRALRPASSSSSKSIMSAPHGRSNGTIAAVARS
jgi:hypothetical protein